MFFKTRCVIRIREEDAITVKNIVARRLDKFDGISHFMRCAILSFMRQELKEIEAKDKEQQQLKTKKVIKWKHKKQNKPVISAEQKQSIS